MTNTERMRICPHCNGHGIVDADGVGCEVCWGTGVVPVERSGE